MADKRISQLIERVDIANNDVLPIVASGATTTNKVTISSIQTFMQSNLDVGVTSVGLSMPSAFTVSNSPVTASGNISVTGAGTVSQYIRGDGSLADFPQGGGGGASVNYYLNGSVSQGTIGGIAYQEMNKVPVLGAGTDFVAIADGYLASFITDAGDPGLLEIPGGNWNFETYFSASSGGGTPTFYVELYKVNSGGTATLIASNSGTPELIAFGTTITPYFSTLAVPTTALAITDRLALRYYVARSGRTITLHTENSHLCQIITTFTTGLTALNGLTAQVQNFATGTSGTDFGISSSVSTHIFNLPDASATARGVVTTGTQTFAGYKIFTGTISANNDIQLAAAGTASTTFIKNISGAGLTSVGSNGFGFNNSDNIYFSGSNKGGGIIAFSNTGNQTYTLQDASGTLAFTSQIPANPVGGTGTTNIIPKFTGGSTLGDSSLQNVSNSISNLNPPSGQFAWQLNGNATTGQSFGALVVAGTNASDIAFAVRNTGGVTTLFEVQGDGNVGIGTNTPSNILEISTTSKGVSDRTGVNLTTSNSSAIDLGLPLVWSSNGTISNYATASIVGRRESATAGNYSGYLQFATTDSSGSLAQRLRIASTGAATFSSSVGVGNAGSTVTFNVNGKSKIGDSFNTAVGGTAGQLDIVGGTAANLLRLFDDNAPSAPRFIVERTGNVGIGTASPGNLLSIEKSSNSGSGSTFPRMSIKNTLATQGDGSSTFNFADILISSGNESVNMFLATTYAAGSWAPAGIINVATNHDLQIKTNNTERMRINSSGDLIVKGTVANISLLGDGVQMHFSRNSTNYIIANGGTGSTIRIISNTNGVELSNGATSWVAVSDENLKEMSEWKPFENSVEKILSLRAGTSRYKTDEEGTTRSFLIAQDVQEVLPEAVSEYEDGTLGLRYTEVIPLLVAAIQELKTEIDSLKNQIK